MLDNILVGCVFFFLGFAAIYKRGFSRWLRGSFRENPPNYFKVVDLVGGLAVCVIGLLILVRGL